LAKIIGKSRAHIGNMLRILTLPLPVKQMIERGELTFGHARTLVPAANPLALAKIMVQKGMNVRQAEAFVQREGTKAYPRAAKARPQIDFAIAGLERDLERVIGLKTKIIPKGRGGSFTVLYSDLDQLDMIIKRLKG
jgi:ParB family chromosome partitioning protein